MDRTFPDLRIERGAGNWHLKQDAGPCDDTSEHWVILEPEQLDTLARMAGYLPIDEITRACERERERLALLAAMVHAHTREGDPLRAAVAALLGVENPSATVRESCAAGQLELEVGQ
jgi:hypothetical protein